MSPNDHQHLPQQSRPLHVQPELDEQVACTHRRGRNQQGETMAGATHIMLSTVARSDNARYLANRSTSKTGNAPHPCLCVSLSSVAFHVKVGKTIVRAVAMNSLSQNRARRNGWRCDNVCRCRNRSRKSRATIEVAVFG